MDKKIKSEYLILFESTKGYCTNEDSFIACIGGITNGV